MKSRPMLFNEPMVRALLDGSKTQTRRVVKPQPTPDDRFSGGHCLAPSKRTEGSKISVEAPYVGLACHYGQIGDRLWGKETWRATRGADRLPPRNIATSCSVWYEADLDHDADNVFIGKRRPSIFMPRWASRITLEIVSVRVERLQDISEADAMAEGCKHYEPANYLSHGGLSHDGRYVHATAIASYKQLWESINGTNSWAANPWVWVLEFRGVTS